MLRSVLGFEGLYVVSNDGRVFRLPGTPKCRYGRELRPHIDYCGYKTLALKKDNKTHQRFVHRLVLEAFQRRRGAFEVARHLNGNKLDNRNGNLCWGTVKENTKDSVKHGSVPHGQRHWKAKLTPVQVRYIRESKKSDTVLARLVGIQRGSVWLIRNKRNWKRVT
jgi:hypothetical protein